MIHTKTNSWRQINNVALYLCHHIVSLSPVVSLLYVNIGSGNGLLADDIKPLPKPIVMRIN